MQGIQPPDCYRSIGKNGISFVQAVVRNRGEHEILLALSSQYPESIEAIRSDFEGLLTQEAIKVWQVPVSSTIGNEDWITETAAIIRRTFLAGLNPDIVHLTELHDLILHRDSDNSADSIPFSMSVFDIQHLASEARHAALLFTGSTQHEQVAAALSGIAPEAIVELPFVETPSEKHWNRIAQEALRCWDKWMEVRSRQAIAAINPLSRPKIAYVSPLPPERSGISDYSAELLPELLHYYNIDLIIDQKKVALPSVAAHCTVRTVDWLKANAHLYDHVLYHFGNSPFHKHMFALLKEVPGIVILHDFFLSGVVVHLDINGIVPGGWAEELYHAHGYKALRHYAQKHDKEIIVRTYPCNYGVLNDSEGVIVHSEYAKQLAEQWYGRQAADHLHVVPHLRVPADPLQRKDARKSLNIDERCFVVCSFGLLGPHKMNHRLLDAWLASSLAADQECLLIFVGENERGDYENKLLETINRHKYGARVSITGWASTETFRYYLAAADAGVQLRTHSRGETSGTVLDCMNYALPTIVNAHGSLAELPEECAIMLPDDFSDNALIDALELLRHNPSYRKQIGTAAQNHIVTQHNPKKVTRQYVEAIESFSCGTEKHRSNAINAIAGIHTLPEDDACLTDIAAAIAASMPSRCIRKQLLIDVSALVQEDLKTGIQRVVRSIVKNLIDNPPEGFSVEPVYATPDKPYRYARSFTMHTIGCLSHNNQDEPVDFHAGDILFIPDLHLQVVKNHKNLLQHIRHIGARVLFLVHDILPVRYPEFFPDGTFDEFQEWLHTVAQSDGAICVTKTVADDLHNWLCSEKPERHRPFLIGWSHHGADIEASIPSKGFTDGFLKTISNLSKNPTVLMVGTVEPRKGHALALQAMELLWNQQMRVNLVIVGKHGWMIDSLAERIGQHRELHRKLHWFQGISDEALLKLYHKASGVLMASEGEGFGLPLIEAAQLGCPVLARDIPVFREIGGNHISYFGGNTPEALASSLKEWIEKLKKNTVPDSASMPWLTWNISCQNLTNMLTDNNHEQWVHHWKTPPTSSQLSHVGTGSTNPVSIWKKVIEAWKKVIEATLMITGVQLLKK